MGNRINPACMCSHARIWYIYIYIYIYRERERERFIDLLFWSTIEQWFRFHRMYSFINLVLEIYFHFFFVLSFLLSSWTYSILWSKPPSSPNFPTSALFSRRKSKPFFPLSSHVRLFTHSIFCLTTHPSDNKINSFAQWITGNGVACSLNLLQYRQR